MMKHGVLALLALVAMLGCSSSSTGGDTGTDTDADTDTDSDSDSDTDADSDTDTDTDTDTDADTDTGYEVNEDGEIVFDCSACPAVGESVEAMACAIELCDDALIASNIFVSPTGSDTGGTHAAVSHFGNLSNDLAPQVEDSYTLIATGPATGTSHTQSMGGDSALDPFVGEPQGSLPIYDVMQWTLDLTAPGEAHGFRFASVYLSAEYDDNIGITCSDNFYVLLEAASTNAGSPTVINFTDCRDPDQYQDFVCESDFCDVGEPYCFQSVNSALSDCCWYAECPEGYSWDVGTDISGTGFECSGSTVDGPTYGSSTGWFRTEWPIEPGESFNLTFHVQDMCDSLFDSEIIIDGFRFLVSEPEPGTTKLD